MSEETIDQLCEHCGQTFSAFLHQMEEQNFKVICPNCRENPDCRSSKDSSAVHPTVKKPN